MRTILPRLRNLLAMLATEPEPLPVKEVADRLRVSKRTVFRELANVDSVLGQYGLGVGSKPGEGVVLEGSHQARSSLLRDLEKMGSPEPADKDGRQGNLLLAILRHPGQKLATHAERFKVSAPTISHDLDELEPMLAERGLDLSRKSGSGISIHGEEIAIRRMILAIAHRRKEHAGDTGSYPHPDILLDLLDLHPELDPIIGWMTPQSRDALTRYMAVMAQRILDSHALEHADNEMTEFSTPANQLATILHEAFNIDVNTHERAALSVELAACRPGPAAREYDAGDNEDDGELSATAAEMASLFDPAQAHMLTMDNVLMDGLITHLRSAVVRIRHRIELADPMLEQLRLAYPDIMNRCRIACEALRQYGEWLPDDEVSLVAAHFGASLLRLAEQGARQRTVRVGIICVHGIGSSYLLASQVKQAFGSRVVAEVAWHDDRDSWRQYDLLVSATELPDAGMRVITVRPILKEDDIARIDEALTQASAGTLAAGFASPGFIDDLHKLEALTASIRILIERFAIIPIPQNATFSELTKTAGNRLGKTAKDAALIRTGLSSREKVSTQILTELNVVFTHCRTEGVTDPVFALMVPEGGCFTDPYFEGALSGIVMLLPRRASREQSEMMGSLSASLIERESFLKAIQSGDENAVRAGLERVLAEFLFQFAMRTLKG